MAGQGRRKRHKREEVVAKLRQVDEPLTAGKDIADAGTGDDGPVEKVI